VAEKEILVMSANEYESRELCSLLRKQCFGVSIYIKVEDVDKDFPDTTPFAVILDVDSISIDNRSIRDLRMKFPNASFLCTSKDRFHPELKEAIRHHIFAFLNKPVDPEELFFWLKCISENNVDSRDPPVIQAKNP